jgi:hypothetical protein
LSTSR